MTHPLPIGEKKMKTFYHYSVKEAQKVGVGHVRIKGGAWVRFSSTSTNPKYNPPYDDGCCVFTGNGTEEVQRPKK